MASKAMQTARHIRADCNGISSIEFALVAAVFFLFIFGLIDFGRAMWEWNAAAKATHRGVRYAVVNDPVSVDVATYNGLSDGLSAGDPIPVDNGSGGEFFPTILCGQTGAGPGCGGSLSSLDTSRANAVAFTAIVDRMRAIYDRIQASNVVVEYRHVGLGVAGTPDSFGPEIQPTVTVRLRDMEFDFVTPGLVGIVNIPMPGFDATMTAEDHQTI